MHKAFPSHLARGFASGAGRLSTGGQQQTQTVVQRKFGPLPRNDNVEPRFLEMIKFYYDRAGEYAQVDRGQLELIKGCNAVYRVTFPFRKKDGTIKMLTGYRAQHSHHRVPIKGGIR